MTVQKIEFGDEGQVATRELVRRFEALFGDLPSDLGPWLRTLESLDRQYGGRAPSRSRTPPS